MTDPFLKFRALIGLTRNRRGPVAPENCDVVVPGGQIRCYVKAVMSRGHFHDGFCSQMMPAVFDIDFPGG